MSGAKFEAEQLVRLPASPFAAPHEIDALDDAARRREDQCPGQIGSCFGEDTGRVRDHDATHFGGNDVDVVVADGDIRDDAEVGEVLELGSTNPPR